MIKKLFVPYKIAEELKEKNFDEPCMGFWNCETDITFQSYNNKQVLHRNTFLTIKGKEAFVYIPEPSDADTNPDYERLKWGIKIVTPTYQQVINFFRKNHKIEINSGIYDNNSELFFGLVAQWKDGKKNYLFYRANFKNYEEALNQAIEEALKLI